jgi:type IV pilus biogenesis protein PilP
MKKTIAIIALVSTGWANAEALDGSRILEQEAQRAQELQRLQHQAEVLKQRAEITRYLEEIKKNGGDVSDLELGGLNMPAQSRAVPAPVAMPSAASVSAPKEQPTLPKLLHIEQNRAAFATSEGTLYARVGSTLPGGYTVVSLNMKDGARLQKNGKHYDIDVAW